MSDMCRRNYFGVCKGGIYVNDWCHHNYIGICKGHLCE